MERGEEAKGEIRRRLRGGGGEVRGKGWRERSGDGVLIENVVLYKSVYIFTVPLSS